VNVHLLSYLKRRADRWADPVAVARAVNLRPRTLHTELAGLRREGFKIDQEPLRGIMLRSGPWPLVAEEIRLKLRTHIVGREVHCLAHTSSTNDVARRLDQRGAPEGTLVLADYQTQGRGRFRRRWIARPREAILMSVLLRPEPRRARASLMTIMGAVAVARSLAVDCGVNAGIRWPNDVLIGKDKVAGILVEKATDSAYVVGIGLNTGAVPDAPGATSLSAHRTGPIDRAEVAVGIATELDRRYMTVLLGEGDRLEADWREMSCTLGEAVALSVGRRTYRGIVDELAIDGITIRFASGFTRRFRAEHVNRLEVVEPGS